MPTRLEIRNAIFSMKGLKAPGPDGIQPLFYQRFWDTVQNSVCLFVQNCFIKGEFPAHLNKSLITLIPKIENPETINQFRPITLCNVIYKIVTKVIDQRIRPVLDRIIGPFQSSFMPVRQTSDNIITTQEIIHSLMKRKSQKKGLIIKIDLEKAYDRISWRFLKKVLENFNFSRNSVNLIMSCVAKGETSILWNGEKTDPFFPSRGLRQGDPLSPYLFVLCLEYLSNLINTKVESKDWIGIKASKNGPVFSHLFFADDLIFFAEANENCCRTIMDVLNDFCMVSGQKVNFHKS